MNDNVKWMIRGGVFGIVVVGFLWWQFMPKRPALLPRITSVTPTASSTSPERKPLPLSSKSEKYTPPPVYATAQSQNEMITVNDQPSGDKVIVTGINVERPTWIAIRDTKSLVLGAAWVTGPKDSVTIELLRPTVAGNFYQAVFYVDNGSKEFDYRHDALVVSVDGAPVASTFSAQ